MSELRFFVEGPGAQDLAQRLEAVLHQNFGESPSRRSSEVQDAAGTRADPVALLTLILALPTAAVAALDLVARLKARDRIRAIIDFAKQERDATGVRIWVSVGDGPPVALDEARPEHLLDAANKAQARPRE